MDLDGKERWEKPASFNSVDLVRAYFRSGRPYNLILARLRILHGVKRSVRWLKERLKRLGLRRRCCTSLTPVPVVRNCIKHLTSESGCLLGYRSVWKILREKYVVNVKRCTVMVLLREMNPSSVRRRGARQMKRRVYTSKGPNHVWHIDQYDKLSKYSFQLHGCIDGFSRKVMWLRVCSTNKNPAVTLGHYIEAIQNAGGFPQRVWLDKGTENSLIAQCQVAFTMCHKDEQQSSMSVQYGSSPANSRIESWWSRLRKQKTDWWIEHFRTLERDDWLDTGSVIHKQCLAFAFLPVFEKEINEYVDFWNTHHIRPTRLASCPSGRPDDIYDMPELFGGQNCLQPVHYGALYYAEQQLVKAPPPPYSRNFYDHCQSLVRNRFHFSMSHKLTPTICTQIYKYLVQNVR